MQPNGTACTCTNTNPGLPLRTRVANRQQQDATEELTTITREHLPRYRLTARSQRLRLQCKVSSIKRPMAQTAPFTNQQSRAPPRFWIHEGWAVLRCARPQFEVSASAPGTLEAGLEATPPLGRLSGSLTRRARRRWLVPIGRSVRSLGGRLETLPTGRGGSMPRRDSGGGGGCGHGRRTDRRSNRYAFG